jgi:hypothetical protein
MLVCLFPDQLEAKRGRLWYVFWATVVTSFAFISGWGFLVSLLVLVFIIRGEVNRLTFRHSARRFIEAGQAIGHEVRQGGFDELTIVRRLEALEQPGFAVPSVLYSLLRQPRRNIESEISSAFKALDDEKKRAIRRKWTAFLDFMLKYDDGEAAGKKEAEYAEIFRPIRNALDKLSYHFESDGTVVFASKSGKGVLLSTYSIVLNENGKQRYTVYIYCEEYPVESGRYLYSLKLTGDLHFSLTFYRGDEGKVVSAISALLLHYRAHRELTSIEMKRFIDRWEA